MNIAFLDSIDENTYGGMEEWIRLVAWGLQKRQNNIFILGREDSAFLKRIHKENKDLTLIPLNIGGDFNPLTISNIKGILSDNNIDILSVNFTKDIRLGGLAARFKGDIKVVWSVGLNITKNSFIHKVLTPHLIDGVIVPSASLKKQITQYNYIKENDVKVIPIGIPDINFDDLKLSARSELRNQYHLSQNSIIALTVGRFVNQKGHIYLIDAAGEIVKKYPQVVFMLLGDGPLENQLKLKVEKLNLSQHFVFAGMLNDLTNYWAGADLMIHPSVEEPFGIAVLEGMRAGLPIVASRVGGIPEVVKENETALLISPKDSSSLATAVMKLLDDSPLLKKLGEEGRKRYERYFTYQKMIDEVEEYFNSVLKTNKKIYS